MNIAIGDIHGKSCWKDFLNQEFDQAYFAGDYFDNYEQTPAVTQIRNFKEICDVARKDSRIHLCLGNHDFQYMRGIPISEKYSGFQNYSYIDIQEAIESNIDLLNLIYIDNNTIISHAGVTKTWLTMINKPLDQVNNAFRENRDICIFDGYNCYGDDITQSPIWVRPNSLLSDSIEGYNHIVGHTKVSDITTIENITLIDCLDTIVKCYKF